MTKDILSDLETTLPRKIINAAMTETRKNFPESSELVSEGNSSDYCAQFSLTEKENELVSNVTASLKWVPVSDYGESRGLILELKGNCSDGLNKINSERESLIWKYKNKIKLSALIGILEDFFLEEWIYTQINLFVQELTGLLENKKEELTA